MSSVLLWHTLLFMCVCPLLTDKVMGTYFTFISKHNTPVSASWLSNDQNVIKEEEIALMGL